jgi:hypothetical protein
LTYDSATSSVSAGRRRIFLPVGGDGYLSIDEREVTGELPATDYMMNECTCWSCRYLRVDYPDGPPRTRRFYISQRMETHNVLLLRRVFGAILEESRRNPDQALRNRLGRRYPSVMRAFEGGGYVATPTGAANSLLNWTG